MRPHHYLFRQLYQSTIDGSISSSISMEVLSSMEKSPLDNEKYEYNIK